VGGTGTRQLRKEASQTGIVESSVKVCLNS